MHYCIVATAAAAAAVASAICHQLDVSAASLQVASLIKPPAKPRPSPAPALAAKVKCQSQQLLAQFGRDGRELQ